MWAILHVDANANTTSKFESGLIQINYGLENLAEGQRLFILENYKEAAHYYWHTIMDHDGSEEYSLFDTFGSFIQCYDLRGKVIDAFFFVTRESIGTNQMDIAKIFVNEALEVDLQNLEALEMQRIIESRDSSAMNTWRDR